MPTSDVVRANALSIREMIPIDLRALVKMSETGTGTMLLEWETRRGFVALEVGVRTFNMAYSPDELDDTQWGTTGTMAQLTALRNKLGGVLPAHEKIRVKMATVLLFKPNGRFYTEEAWPVPEGATGPWSMRESPEFHRIDGGAVLVEAQEPWGVAHLL